MLGWNIRQNFDKDIMGYLGLGVTSNNRELINETIRNSARTFSYSAGAKYFYNSEMIITAELKGFNNYLASGFSHELYLAPGIFYKGSKIPISSASLLIGLSPDAIERRKVILYLEKKF